MAEETQDRITSNLRRNAGGILPSISEPDTLDVCVNAAHGLPVSPLRPITVTAYSPRSRPSLIGLIMALFATPLVTCIQSL
jgi:hypothetical protein